MKLCEMTTNQISALPHDYIEILCSKHHQLLDLVQLVRNDKWNYQIKYRGKTPEEKEMNRNRFVLVYGILQRRPLSDYCKNNMPVL